MPNAKTSFRSVMISGAGSGIGRSIAIAFAQQGWQVTIMGRRREALQDTIALAGTCGANLRAVVGNVTDRGDVLSAVDGAADAQDGLNILVNNAGINTVQRNLSDISDEDWDRVMEVNLTGAYNCFRAALPHFEAGSDGLVINIASMAGKRAGTVGGVAYSASKFGLGALTQSINAEFRNAGIRATCIYPGEVDTPILDKRPVPVTAEKRSAALQPEDIASAALMVALMPERAVVEEITIFPRRSVN